MGPNTQHLTRGSLLGREGRLGQPAAPQPVDRPHLEEALAADLLQPDDQHALARLNRDPGRLAAPPRPLAQWHTGRDRAPGPRVDLGDPALESRDRSRQLLDLA